MRLVEMEAKGLLREAGLPVPGGRLWEDGGTAAGPVVVKAQLLTGGRGKLGLIRTADPQSLAEEVATVTSRMTARGMRPMVMIEDRIRADSEYYLAWRIDDLRQAPVLMFSTHGGIEIEENSVSIREHFVDPLEHFGPSHLVAFFREAGAEARHIGALVRFAVAAYRLFVAEDLDLIEINPLGATAKGAVIAMDVKISIDDSALTRHQRWRGSLSDELETADRPEVESRAAANGLTFVDLEGNIALLTSGAGLGMALIDLLADEGMRAANFVDASGGSGSDVFRSIGELVFERAARPDVQAILMFFTLTATSLKVAVDSLLETIATGVPKPLVIGLVASGAAVRELNLEQARAAFVERGFETAGEMDEAVAAVKRMVWQNAATSAVGCRAPGETEV